MCQALGDPGNAWVVGLDRVSGGPNVCVGIPVGFGKLGCGSISGVWGVRLGRLWWILEYWIGGVPPGTGMLGWGGWIGILVGMGLLGWVGPSGVWGAGLQGSWQSLG